jgi:hypothetical protein
VNFKVDETIDSITQFLLVLPTSPTKCILLDSVACKPTKASESRVGIDFEGKLSNALALDTATGTIFYQSIKL